MYKYPTAITTQALAYRHYLGMEMNAATTNRDLTETKT
jgi:hypothetical protein